MGLGVGGFFLGFFFFTSSTAIQGRAAAWQVAVHAAVSARGAMSAFNFLASMIKRHLLSGFFIGHARELSREHVWERICLFARAVITTAILIYD